MVLTRPQTTQSKKDFGPILCPPYQESGYQLLRGRHYKSLGPSPYGGDAEAICNREGGHLPTLRTQEDIADIHELRGDILQIQVYPPSSTSPLSNLPPYTCKHRRYNPSVPCPVIRDRPD